MIHGQPAEPKLLSATIADDIIPDEDVKTSSLCLMQVFVSLVCTVIEQDFLHF